MKYVKVHLTKILLALLTVLLTLVGLFCVFDKNERQISASAESEFALAQGLQFGVSDGLDGTMRFKLSLTQDMIDKLSNNGANDKSNFYLRFVRTRVGVDGGDEKTYWYYNINPDTANPDAYSQKLEIFNGEYNVAMRVPYTENYSDEYTYWVEYIEYKPATAGDYIKFIFSNLFNPFALFSETDLGSIETLGTTNALTFDIQTVAQNYLSTNPTLSDDELAVFNDLAGYVPCTDSVEISVVYEECYDLGLTRSKTENVGRVKSLYAYSGRNVFDVLCKDKGFDIFSYNAVYDSPYYQKIVKQAVGYDYAYDETNGGTLTIKYADYLIKDFFIYINDNDTTDGVNMSFVMSDINPIIENGVITMTYKYTDMETNTFNGLSWVGSITKENVNVANDTDTVSVDIGETEITVTVAEENQADLSKVGIYVLSNIVPDTEITLNIKYQELSFDGNDLSVDEQTITTTMLYSQAVALNHIDLFKESSYYATVLSALECDVVDGYMTPSGVDLEHTTPRVFDDDGNELTKGVSTLTVEYAYKTLFKIINGENVRFVACADVVLPYYGYDYLGLAPTSEEYRLKSITTDGSDVSIKFNESKVDELQVTLDVSAYENTIIPLYVEYTDEWNLVIDYLKPYKDTPFATREQYQTTVKVKDYDFGTKTLAIADVKTLLGMQKMTLAKIVEPDDAVSVELTSSSTYTAYVTYGHTSISAIDNAGRREEVKVYFSSYDEWCKSFGADWSVLMLNTKNKTYFRTSNEVDRNKVYGMFSSAIFDEQVSDINHLFRDVTGAGQMVLYQTVSAKGSALYQTFYELSQKTLLALIGNLGMQFCELFDDNNNLCYSYFFYVDGSTPNGFISTGRADSFDDKDNAFENWSDDVGDDVKKFWDDLMKAFKDSGKKAKEIFVAILFAVVVIWLISLIPPKEDKKDRKNKKRK